MFPLSMPDPAQLPAEEKELVTLVSEYEASRLFVERARLQKPGFALTAENAADVAAICHRLDGIPLAIELAAARVRSLSVEQIASRLQDRFSLLTGGSSTALLRHQTLRATIEWSHGLLTEGERRLMDRLCVFAGGWTLEAAEAICSGDGIKKGEVLDLLTGLVDKSLVIFEHLDARPRYRLLETIREYGGEQLEATGLLVPMRQKHLDYFLNLAEDAELHLTGAQQVEWLQRLESEHDNLRAALHWSQIDKESDLAGLRLVGALWQFWHIRSYWSEGRDYLQAALSLKAASQRTLARAKALNGAGYLARNQADYAAAQTLCEESLSIASELENKSQISISLYNLGVNAFYQGDFVKARSFYEECLAIRRKLGDKQGIAEALLSLGNVATEQGDYLAAEAPYEQSLKMRQELGDKRGIAYSFNSLATVARLQGDYMKARALYEESLAIRRELGDKRGIAESLHNLGIVATEQGDYAQARAFYEESLAIRRQVGDKRGIAYSLSGLGTLAHRQADYARARTRYEEGLAIRRELGDKWGTAHSLGNLAVVAEEQGDFTAARALQEESLVIRREMGDRWGMALSLNNLGHVAFHLGDYAQSRTLYAESLTTRRELGDKQGIAYSLKAMADLAAAQGQIERAARLWAAAEALRETIGHAMATKDKEEYDRQVMEARAACCDEEFKKLWREGQEMTLEQAVEYALQDKQQESTGRPAE